MTAHDPNLNLAVRALRKASRLLVRDFLEVRLLLPSVKGSEQFANQALQRAESTLHEELLAARPHYSFHSPTLGAIEGSDPTRDWIVNAVDGFVNYSQGIPHWVMTASLLHKDKPVLAAIFNPLENEMFTAETGIGSRLNNGRIRVSRKSQAAKFVVGCEEISRQQFEMDCDHDASLRRVMSSGIQCRSFGSISQDLVHVSCGRLDGYWSHTTNPASLPAATLLLAEAGGLIENLNRKENSGLVAAGSDGFRSFAALVRGDAD
ncbi:MAG: inositol monophosphatase [Rhodobacteraceae bacterium]|nr:inositol monophosphatase [Paracoccaceae bacterium]MCY4197190.1 inositol monophosphatase [Paracoccaceae bacterium]MCY4327578.1 inositol monophosphatase [Paracoccaceae bacterium]